MATRLFEAAAPDVLYLVDLSGYVFRAYHAIAPLNSPSGEPTHAVFGTVNMLERLVRQCKPRLMAVAMDSRTPTFRKEMYPAYKANRPPPPEDLKQQMQRVWEVIEAFPIRVFQKDGVEADDIIASVVRQCREQKRRVVIVSADKDLMQLVGPDVIMWDTMRDRVFGPEEVEERFGVAITQVRDVLALMGDSSDNIPGVPSVGPKTAKDLIVEYGDIAGIYAALDKIKRKKLRETLEENREQALMSQRLITLKDDVELEVNDQTVAFERKGTERLRQLYSDLGFTRQLANLEGAGSSSRSKDTSNGSGPSERPRSGASGFDPTRVEVMLVKKDAQLAALAKSAKAAGQIAVYPLLHGTVPLTAAWIGLGVCISDGKAAYVPLAHRYMGVPEQLTEECVSEWVRELVKLDLAWILYDSKSLMVLFQEREINLEGAAFDVLLANYLLDAGGAQDLERIAKAQLDVDLAPYDALFKKKGKRATPVDELSLEEAGEFVGQRAATLFALRRQMETRLEEETLDKLYRDTELPLAPLLACLERRGILLDTAALEKLGQEVGTKLVELEKEAHRIAGKEFNVNSPRQLEKLLFDELGLKPIRRTKTSRSTDAETLEALSEQHELPKVILEVRQLAKLKGTYIDALPQLVNERTGRLHTRWHQDVAATGRLSSSDPNLQNIPIRTELGRSIREAFIAPEGYELISADYSQIELRVLAHLSQDPVLIDAFNNQQDIHQRTAMEIFEVDADEVDAELRRQAKAVNFGVIYGQGDNALAKSLGISRMEAGQFIAAYFRRYQGVQKFMDETLEKARASGRVRTLFGRRRLVPDIHSNNRARRLAAERIVMNAPIQGTAADLMKMAMLALQAPVTPGCRMLLTVHDELVFEVPVGEVAEAREKIQHAMQEVYPLDVPLVVDVGSGPNWKVAH